MSRFIRIRNYIFNLDKVISIVMVFPKNSIEITIDQELSNTINKTNMRTFNINFLDWQNMDNKYYDIINKLKSNEKVIDLDKP